MVENASLQNCSKYCLKNYKDWTLLLCYERQNHQKFQKPRRPEIFSLISGTDRQHYPRQGRPARSSLRNTLCVSFVVGGGGGVSARTSDLRASGADGSRHAADLWGNPRRAGTYRRNALGTRLQVLTFFCSKGRRGQFPGKTPRFRLRFGPIRDPRGFVMLSLSL